MIVGIYIVFLRKLRPLFLYLTYELVQIFITFNRTDISLPKPVNEYVYIEKNCPNVHCT